VRVLGTNAAALWMSTPLGQSTRRSGVNFSSQLAETG
jgi:hypothetical protein